MENCIKLDTCGEILSLDSRDLMPWQLTKARKEMCSKCSLFESNNLAVRISTSATGVNEPKSDRLLSTKIYETIISSLEGSKFPETEEELASFLTKACLMVAKAQIQSLENDHEIELQVAFDRGMKIGDAECQARAEGIFREIENKEEQDMKSDSFLVIESMDWWQSLKKRAGVK